MSKITEKPDQGNERETVLKTEIQALKKKLAQAFQKNISFIHPEVLQISRMLDEKILEYTRLMKAQHREDDIPTDIYHDGS